MILINPLPKVREIFCLTRFFRIPFFNLLISIELSTVCLYCKNEIAIVLLAECHGSSHVQ